MGCFSFFGSCWCSGSAKDSRATEQARAGLQDIIKGYRQIAQLDLPPGAAHLIANVRRNIVELEAIMRDVKMPKPRQWLLPLPQEQADWEAVHPKGGFLLRRQMCMAAFGDDEWVVGCLFISEFGIAFDSGHIAGEGVSFLTGFLQWNDISSLTHVAPSDVKPKGLITASIAARAKRKFAALQLQLSIHDDAEWLLEFWRLRADAAPEQAAPEPVEDSWDVPDSDEGIQLPPPSRQARLMTPSGQQQGDPVSLQSAPPKRGRMQRANSILEQRICALKKVTRKFSEDVTRKLSEDISSGFAETSTGNTAAEAPSTEAPVKVERLTSLALEQVCKALESDDCVPRFLRENVQAFEVSPTPWAKSRRVSGTLVRRVAYRMTLPKDVPRVVQRLISLPDDTSVTGVYRLRSETSRVVLTHQTCTHDVTFGENFRVQETLSFEPVSAGGVELKHWVEIVWVAPLPWTHGAIKSYIEKKARGEAVEGLPVLLAIIKDLGA